MTPAEEAAWVALMRLGPMPLVRGHGSDYMYQLLACRCAECRAGSAARQRDYRARRKARELSK